MSFSLLVVFGPGRAGEFEAVLLLCILILEDFTEELLSQHDAEIQRLKLYFEDHRDLFDGVRQWEENWRLFQELEVSLDFPKQPELSFRSEDFQQRIITLFV